MPLAAGPKSEALDQAFQVAEELRETRGGTARVRSETSADGREVRCVRRQPGSVRAPSHLPGLDRSVPQVEILAETPPVQVPLHVEETPVVTETRQRASPQPYHFRRVTRDQGPTPEDPDRRPITLVESA